MNTGALDLFRAIALSIGRVHFLFFAQIVDGLA